MKLNSKDEQLLAEAYIKVLKETESAEALKTKIKDLEKARKDAYYEDNMAQEFSIGREITKLKDKLKKLQTESWAEDETVEADERGIDDHDYKEEDPMDELEFERQFFEIIGDLKYNKPELFDMFIQRLEDKGFRNQLKSIAGVSL